MPNRPSGKSLLGLKMLNVQENVSLQPFNTFGINVHSRYFLQCDNLDQIKNALSESKTTLSPLLILGGGSNILFTKDWNGLTLLNRIKGINVIAESDNDITLEVGGGENWHDFVLHCVNKGYAGVENLSLIPGCVGASPIQNIGAYGVEMKDTFQYLRAIEIETGEEAKFNYNDCEFGYRDSVFKRHLKGKYLITHVAYSLSKNASVNTSYGAINNQLELMKVSNPSIKDVSDAVISIRQSKLPDPKEIGNSGSFFKNPVISRIEFNRIIAEFPEVANYPIDQDNVKLAAGWLIDQAGWKGKTIDNYGVHKNQALVLVNYGGASGKDIYNLSEDIISSIKEKYGITLEREVNML